jgi:hypothetical protein
MLGAAEDIVRRGGQRGIGCVVVTQRSAVLNKNVLTQAQMLIALRTIAPQDLEAMDAWIQVHGEPEQRKTLMESLPSLPTGDAWFWSPGWPTVEGIFKRAHVLPIETFDSGATPEPGQKRVEPKHVADVDLDALKRQMAATIEKAKENDPKELNKQIAALKVELRKVHSGKLQTPAVETKTIEVPVLDVAGKVAIDQAAGMFNQAKNAFELAGTILGEVITRLKQFAPTGQLTSPVAVSRQTRSSAPAQRPQRVVSSSESTGAANGSLPKAERAILRVLANYPDGKAKREIGVIAGYRHTGGGFNNAIGALRSKGYIEGSDPLRITESGMEAYGPVDPLPSGPELFAYWQNHPDLGRAEREILRVLYEAAGQALTKEQIAPLTVSDKGMPYEPQGGGFNNAVGRLRTFELIEGRGDLRAVKEFFE